MTSILHKKYFKELKEYAEFYSIPIITDGGLEYLKDYIKRNNVKSILEIGTAIGYSAIHMALVDEKIRVVSIERDEKRYLEAIKNIKKFFLENRITLIFNDAINVELDEKFDLIFIDAAKGQYINHFNHFKKYLKDDGTIITDNIEFHGLVESEEEIESKGLQGIVTKIRNYIEFLNENEEYETKYIKAGDGLAVTKKRRD
ncbi:MAG: O-methyltransferase [Bacilli bacterium]|nr:O-methyltransferase [Bacilli bacterium]